jgi:hypothetical protein
MPVGMAAGAAEQIPVERPADIGGGGVSEFLRVKGYRVVLINRLAINHRLGWRAIVIDTSLIVAPGEFRLVAVLSEIQVQPGFVMKPLRRTAAACGVEGD